MPKAIHTPPPTSGSILISSHLMSDPDTISHFKVYFFKACLPPEMQCQALNETDSEMNICVQEIYPGLLSETTPMRQ